MKSPATLAAISMIAGFFAAKWILSMLNAANPAANLPPPITIQIPEPEQTSAPNEIRFPLTSADVALDREYPTIVADPKTNAITVAWAATTRPDSGNTSRTLWLTRSTDGGKTFSPPKPWREVPVFAYTSGDGKSAQEKSNTDAGNNKTEEKSKPARAPMTFSTHLLPRLIMAGDRMVLGWVEAINGGPKAAFYVAQSTDGGLTFSQPRAIGAEQANRPGFIALAADDQGRILASWLDNPAKSDNTTEKKAENARSSGGPKVFICRETADKTGFEPARLVYEGPENKGVCPCCDVSAIAAPNNQLLYAFRNNVADIRDIWLGSVASDKIIPPIAISDRGWNFAGCPHDGPSMARFGEKIIAGWMDAKDGKPRIFLSTFPAAQPASVETVPATPAPEGSQSHVRVIPDGSGGVYIAWDQSELKQPGGMHAAHQTKPESNATARGIVLAHRPTGSSQIASRFEIKSPANRLPRNPAISSSSDAIVLAWTELGGPEGKSVRIQRVAQSSFIPVETPPANPNNK